MCTKGNLEASLTCSCPALWGRSQKYACSPSIGKNFSAKWCRNYSALLSICTCLCLYLHVYTDLSPQPCLCSLHWTSPAVYLPGAPSSSQRRIHYLFIQNSPSFEHHFTYWQWKWEVSLPQIWMRDFSQELWYLSGTLETKTWALGILKIILSYFQLFPWPQSQQWNYWIREDEIFYGSWFNIDKDTTSPLVGSVGIHTTASLPPDSVSH